MFIAEAITIPLGSYAKWNVNWKLGTELKYLTWSLGFSFVQFSTA
jgi:hypothetical protein